MLWQSVSYFSSFFFIVDLITFLVRVIIIVVIIVRGTWRVRGRWSVAIVFFLLSLWLLFLDLFVSVAIRWVAIITAAIALRLLFLFLSWLLLVFASLFIIITATLFVIIIFIAVILVAVILITIVVAATDILVAIVLLFALGNLGFSLKLRGILLVVFKLFLESILFVTSSFQVLFEFLTEFSEGLRSVFLHFLLLLGGDTVDTVVDFEQATEDPPRQRLQFVIGENRADTLIHLLLNHFEISENGPEILVLRVLFGLVKHLV